MPGQFQFYRLNVPVSHHFWFVSESQIWYRFRNFKRGTIYTCDENNFMHIYTFAKITNRSDFSRTVPFYKLSIPVSHHFWGFFQESDLILIPKFQPQDNLLQPVKIILYIFIHLLRWPSVPIFPGQPQFYRVNVPMSRPFC